MKQAMFAHKTVIPGLVLALLMLALFCGYIQIANHSAGANGAECSRSLLLAAYVPSKDSGLFLSILFFLLTALAVLTKDSSHPRRRFDAPPRSSLIFLKAAESIHTPYNPILQALRRGILHPQIYNLAVS